MAKRQKTKRFSIQAYDNEHYRLTEQYTRAVDALFNAATKAIADVAAKGEYDPNKPFTYKDHPKVQRAVHKVTKQLADRLVTVIETGSKKQWLFACAKNDAFVAAIMDTSKLRKGQLSKMQDKNLDALQAFQQRKVDGMNLSQRVWNYVGQYKDQMEQALDVGLGEGRSAQQLARDVKQNLVEPNRLFRRVRDKHGNLVLSKAAKAYHPGRGVYRSSVKNAQRLTRSEINMAYRESDYRRWQQLDFVIGIEVKRSNHEPLFKCDLCEQLVGKYPKTFKFVGWHPQCMCYAVPILADAETTDKNTLSHWRNVLYGEEYKKYEAKGTVKDVPDNFKQWVKDHIDKQKNWANTPYFIRDNFKDGLLKNGLKPTALPQINVNPLSIEIPYSDLDSATQRKYRADFDLLRELPEALDDACRIYGVSKQAFTNLVSSISANGDIQYWRIEELRNEVKRIEQEVVNAMKQAKAQAQTLIKEFKNGIESARKWIDVAQYEAQLAFSQDMFNDECHEQYGNFITFIHSTTLQRDFRPLIEDAKDKWQAAHNEADDVIRLYANVADVSRLEALLNELPTNNYPAYEITKHIELEIQKIETPTIKNHREVERILGITQGKEMTFDEANELRGNPNYQPQYLPDPNGTIYLVGKSGTWRRNPNYKMQYAENCQVCVVANELRRRGFNVQAYGNTKKRGSIPEVLSHDTADAWRDKNGRKPLQQRAGGVYWKNNQWETPSFADMMKEFEQLTKAVGRYHINWGWDTKAGHIITAERLPNGKLCVYDPQNGQIISNFLKYALDFDLKTGIYVLRVDELLINTKILHGMVFKS